MSAADISEGTRSQAADVTDALETRVLQLVMKQTKIPLMSFTCAWRSRNYR
jgi:hypothetical protein